MKRPYLALFLIATTGCGGGAAERPRPIPSLPGHCAVAGEWTSGELEVADGSFTYASVREAPARIDLDVRPPLARVQVDGFSLGGTVDLGGTLRIVPPTALGENVLLPPGAEVSILSIDADHASIGLGRFSFAESDQMTWVVAPRTIVPCTSLGLGFAYRDEESERRERLALGLPLDPPARFVAIDHPLAIAARPGGPTQVTLDAREYSERLLWLEEQGGFTHVALQHWTGATLVGWAPSSELLTEEPAGGDAYGSGGLLGSLAGPRTYQSCHADHSLVLSVRRISTTDDRGEHTPLASAGPPIVVGTIDGGTAFVRLETRSDGTARIEPHPQAHLYVDADAEWLVPSETFSCVEETYAPNAAFADLTDLTVD